MADLSGEANGIFEMEVTVDGGKVSVYSTSGLLLMRGTKVDVMKRLPRGIYIIRGKKVFVN